MDSLKNISQFNTGSTIANGMKLSESAVISYKAAIDGLSLSQAQAALSSTALTDAQKEQILTSAGLLQSTEAITLEEVKQLASSVSLSAQKKEEILTTLQGAYSENEWNKERLEAIANSGGEAGAIAQSILAKKAENAENVKGVASSKALTASLWAQLKARLALLAANPAAWIAGAIALGAGLVAIEKKLTKSLEECTEELDKNNSAFDEAQSEAESLQSEWETCQKRLGELQKLADNGTISIIEQEEYERLQKTNDELERNIRIQKEKAQLSAIDSANSADETLSKTVESKYKTSWQDFTGMGVATEQAAWITPEEELSASIEEYNRLQTVIDNLSQSYHNGSISEEEYNTKLTDLTNQQTDARNRASEMNDILEDCKQAYENLDNTGAEFKKTQTANYDSVKQATDGYNDFLATINDVDTAFENLDTTEKAQTIKNKYAHKTLSLPNGQGSYTVDDKEISDWIDTLSDGDLEVLASINFSGEQTKESMQEALDYAKNNVDGNVDETSILSFDEVWDSEDFANAKKELLSLAEAGQLTPETLQSTEEYQRLLDQTGISAEEAAKKINSMTDASTQLQSMSAQISKMSDMLADKKKGTTASASDLAGFDVEVRGLDSWSEFEKVMGSSTSTIEECQAAANTLASEWINNGNYLANLTEENKDYYQTQLSNMGIENAAAIVTDTLAAKKLAEKYAIEDLSDATRDEISVKYQEIAALVKEGEVSGTTASALYDLIYQQTIFSNQNLDVYGKISALQELALAFGITADAALGASQAINLENQLRLAKHYGATDAQVNTYAAQLTSKMQDAIKAQFGSISTSISPIGSSGYKGGSSKSGGSGSGSDSKQTIDWISRLLDVLQKKIDQTKAKFENLFTLKDKKNNLTKQIQLTKSLLTATEKSADRYLKAANKVGLSDALKKKVQNGSYDIKEYDSKTSEKISKYQDYYDKYKELKQQADELTTDIRSLREQRYQLYVDDAEAKIAKSQAYAELDAGNYKEQNKHLEYQKKQIKTQYDYLIKIAKLNKDSVEVAKLQAEYQKEIADLTKQEFDNIAETYDLRIGLTDSKIKAFQDQISLLEARGQSVGSALYTKQMELVQSNMNKLTAEREAQISKLAEIEKGTKNWYEAQQAVMDTTAALVECQIEMENLQNSINNLKFDRFDDLLNKINDIVDETNFLKDMLSDNLFDDNGMITDDGITAMGLTAQNYDTYLAEAEKYKQMLSDVKDMYDAGTISLEEYEEYQRKYSQSQRDAIKSANDAKKAVISYVRDGLEKQNQALEEAVNKKIELLKAEKDLKDFQDRLADSNKTIADLQKQINALEGDNSEENRKKLQQLRSDLAKAEKNQSDMLYDRSVEDTEKSLSELIENSKQQAEEYLKDSEKVFVDALSYINAHTSQVSQNLERLSQKLGFEISDNIASAWKDSGKAVDTYENILAGSVPSITTQIGLITTKWQEQTRAIEAATEAAMKAATVTYQEHENVGAQPTGQKTGVHGNSGYADAGQMSGKPDALLLKDAKEFINKNKKPTSKNGNYYSLNKYILEKTGGVLSKESEAQLADMLGVSISSRELTGEQGKRDLDKILAKLKSIGFSTGGFVNVKDAIRYSGEDGLALVRNDEYILSPKETDGFLTLAEHAPQLAESLKNMSIPQWNYPQIDRDILLRNSASQSPVYHIDNSITVEGVATNEIVKDMADVATRQAEKVVSKINNMTYTKGVRRK